MIRHSAGVVATGAFLIMLMTLTTPGFASATWEHSVSEDIMTGEKTCYAMSPLTPSVKPFSSPYTGTEAWLGVMARGDGTWAFVGFSTAPNIRMSEARDGHSVFDTRVRWGDTLENYRMIQEWGSNFIIFLLSRDDPYRDDYDAIEKIYQSEYVLLELDWYGQGLVHFRFPMGGAKEAIDAMYEACEITP